MQALFPDFSVVPNEWYEKYKLRRYGFHGISHFYVAKQAADYLKQDLQQLNLITAHLGNGCSVTCIQNGKSIDTSMGFTPLEGVVMGTRYECFYSTPSYSPVFRSGDFGAGAIEYYCKQTGENVSDVVKILNTQSGMKGLCGSNDMREVVKRKSEGDKQVPYLTNFRTVIYLLNRHN